MNQTALCVIPARYGSTRLPAKPLADLDGRTLIERVYARASAAQTTAATLVASLCHPMAPSVRDDPNTVKVVCAHNGQVLYFSRAPIPYSRQGGPAQTLQHLGLYAYRREFLLGLDALPPSPLAETESLEQLRFLQAGVPMLMGRTSPLAGPSIDTDADLTRARAIIAHDPEA